MPGIPEPILGSDPLTGIIAALLSVLIIGIFVYTSVKLEISAVMLSGVGAVSYGVFAAGVWAGVRLLFHHFALNPTIEPLQFAWLIIIAGGLLAAQAAIPFFLFARFNFILPLVGFAAISTLLLFVFLRVGGETDPLALFGFGFAPFFIGSLLALAALEAGVRYILANVAAIDLGDAF